MRESRHCAYLRCTADLLESDSVNAMRQIPHHFFVTCYDHSLFVSYTAFRLARRWGLDCAEAARAGLLHDLYLYDPKDHSSYQGCQCFAHPAAALVNAQKLTRLSRKEENAILSHMWPLSRQMPRSRVALAVNLADKVCAVLELSCLYRLLHMEQRLQWMREPAAGADSPAPDSSVPTSPAPDGPMPAPCAGL